MRVLVNYDRLEKPYLGMLAVLLRDAGVQAMSTAAAHTQVELMHRAKQAGAEAVIVCNKDTLQAMLQDPKASLDAYRGSRIDYEVPTLVCNSLMHIISKPEGEWLWRRDIEKLRTIRKARSPFHMQVLDSTDKMQAAISFLQECELIALDIETDLLNAPDQKKEPDNVQAGDTIITCCGWAGLHPTKGIVTFVLPLVLFGQDYWRTDHEYEAALRCLQDINRNSVPKVMQNGMYDSTHLIRYNAEPYNWVLDTYGMGWAEYSELSRDLSFLSSLHLYDHLHWKEDLATAKRSHDTYQYLTYNAQDCWRTLRIALVQLRNIPAYARINYAKHFKMVYPSLYCSFEGLLINNQEREVVKAEAEDKLEKALKNLQVMFADPNFNPGSWQQVEHYIYKVFGAKKPMIGKSKSATDEKNLTAVGQQHPLLAKLTTEILSYREAQKAIGTYFTFPQLNGRLLYALDPFGTETGRMACRASNMWCGTQVQNIPGYAKRMLVADSGYELVEIDNKQSEARCTAYLAKEYNLVAALEDATRDFYKQLGTLFFQIPYEEVTDFFRNKVLKRIVHGTNYMMGENTFIENIGAQVLYETAEKLGLSIVSIPTRNNPKQKTLKEFAKSLLEVYHKPFPRIRLWYKELYAEILATGQLVSPSGITRKFFGNIVKDHKILRSAVAHKPQNLSVEILNVGYYRIYKELVLPSRGAFRLKAQVHDSVLAQYKKEERNIWLPAMKECLHNPIDIYGRTLIIPTDANVGPTWFKKDMSEA